MASIEQIAKWRIKQKCIFNYVDMYNKSKDLLRDYGYKVIEKNYTEEITGDSKKTEIAWNATKKVSDYFKFVISISWLILNMKNVEVQSKEGRIKMNSGEPEITIKAYLIKDYRHEWELNSFWKFLRGFYERYIVKSRKNECKDKLNVEVLEFNKYLKSFLLSSGVN